MTQLINDFREMHRVAPGFVRTVVALLGVAVMLGIVALVALPVLG